MTLVIPSSTSNISLISGAAFTRRKNNCLTRCHNLRKYTKQTSYAQELVFPLSTSFRLFPRIRTCGLHHNARIQVVSATGTDVAVEEPDSPVAHKDSSDALGISSVAETSEKVSSKSDTSPTQGQSRRSRPFRKSELPPVKNEELVPGATFTGKVRSIQPFGAFVDFGAFTDGLVHVSQLSDSFVKDVGTVVSIGQEVKVRLVEANTETGRISLTMRESDDVSKLQQPPGDTDKTRPPRRNTLKSNQRRDDKKISKFVKGQDLDGKVKNLARAGSFISLPDGEEGFLPTEEEADDGLGSLMGASTLQVDQEVHVRVLRITRGRVTLTMKDEEDVGALNSKLSPGTVHTATSPFLLAFRKNKDIAAFLDEREKEEASTEESESSLVPSAIDETLEDDKQHEHEVDIGAGKTVDASPAVIVKNEKPESIVSDSLQTVDTAVESIEINAEISSEILSPKGRVSSANPITEAAPATAEVEIGESEEAIAKDVSSVNPITEAAPATAELEIGGSEEAIAKDVSSANPITEAAPATAEVEIGESEEAIATDVSSANPIIEAGPAIAEVEIGESEEAIAKDVSSVNPTTKAAPATAEVEIGESEEAIAKEAPATVEVETRESEAAIAKDEPQMEPLIVDTEASAPISVENEKVEFNADESISSTGSNGQIDVHPPQESTSKESQVREVVDNQIDNTSAADEVLVQTTPTDSEVPSATPVEDNDVGPIPEQNGSINNSNGQSSAPSPKENTTKASISPALVKQLRNETGAGMMDCKNALSETGGDIIKAQEYLRKKGLASADKKASRATAEGRIGSYIHDGRIGVLIEANCETDFVSRGDIFKELVDDQAMQVAACPQVQYVNTEDVPKEIVEKEKEIEMQREDLLSKPEQIRAKIVEGRIRKRLEELALLEQPFIKNDKVVVRDIVKQTIALIGENMKVKRFARFNLGEGLEKKSVDFAAEVAAQTAAKQVPAPPKEQPAATETKESDEKAPKATISAALVKQLREESGAGMMDCKKALSESGGDLGKAQEYLRKKGLSAADKKSSRIAAEGRIGSYIHDSRIGVLIEVNCETDFVGRSKEFKELVDDLAMQVVASSQVQYVSVEDIPESIVSKEKELEMQRVDILSKPESIRERIVEGRVSKRLGELALLEQPFIKDDKILVKDLVKLTVAALGENVKVRRFVRFTLGEASDAKTETEA